MECIAPSYMVVTSSMCVTDRPCYLSQMILMGDGVGASDAQLYNGMGSSGEKIFELRAPVNTVKNINLSDRLYLDGGIYLSIGSNVAGVLVVYYIA